uniref:RING-type domain-containing protein n=2 Tax=Strongyloides papillosus TaxID=174720 RepID=A0A0N5BY53_STREA
MPLICAICSEGYTANGTEHALCSTKCGHLFGKSCLEKWARENNNQGRFECPVCCEPIRDSDCHPIYGLPKELVEIKSHDSEDKCLSDDDILKRCILGILKKGSTLFIKKESRKIYKKSVEIIDVHNGYILIVGQHTEAVKIYKKSVEIIDVHNGYILIAGQHPSEQSFMTIYKGNDLIYNGCFGSVPPSAATFNKFSEDAVEFCVGFENGALQDVVLSLNNGVCRDPIENVLFNEDKRIDSMCFLYKNKVVYSTRGCKIFSLSTDKNRIKEDWLGNVNININAITNLNLVNDHVLLGIMDGKIYVFEKNKIPYVFYSEENKKVINFTYDSVVDMILIVNSSQSESNEKDVSNVFRRISKTSMCDNAGCRREVYINSPVEDLPNIVYHLPKKFNPTIISTKDCEKYFIYSFVPNVEKGILQVHLMSFVCVICSDSYTGNGTEHAIFSTKCGHLFGKSCLEKWARENSNQGKFKCPVCCEPVRDSDYHQIYDLPKELLKIKIDDGEDVCCNEDDILKRCLLGTLDKESTFFIETGDRALSREFVTFFDVHNGFILIAGNHEYICKDTDSRNYFLRIYKGLDIFYDRVFGSVPFTTVAFNKFREDAVEFCVGFENGSLQSVVLIPNNGICGTTHERVLFNEESKINSVCFLEKNIVVYSVGECNIFSVPTDNALDK